MPRIPHFCPADDLAETWIKEGEHCAGCGWLAQDETTPTVNATLRLPAPLAAALDQAARESGTSRHQLILDILQESLAGALSPDLVIGYVPLAGGELDPDVECPMCGQPLADPHVGFYAGARHPIPFGPVCAGCAHSE